MSMIGTVIVTLLATLILWGTGRFVLRSAGVTTHTDIMSIGVGLAAVLAAGGVLNALGLAYAPALWSLVGIGSVATGLELRRVDISVNRWPMPPVVVLAAALLIIGATLFAIITQAPPRGFNFHDDLEKYFAHPVRMLATGTLGGSPLNSLGLSTLGGQAFLQGFVLSLVPIQYINGLDAVFGLAVLLGTGAALAWRLAPGTFGVLLVPLALVTINPLYVNTSGVYLPCALMLSAFALMMQERPGTGAGSGIILGLLYAGLVALKVTYLLFALVHFSLALITVYQTAGSLRQATRWAGRVVAASAAGIAPWLFVYRTNYLHWGLNPGGEAVAGAGPLPNLLSSHYRFWGESYASYTLIAVICAVAAMLCAWTSRDRARQHQGLLLGAFAASGTGFLSYLLSITTLGPLAFGFDAAVRYAIPILSAAAAVALGVLPRVPLRATSTLALNLAIPAGAAIILTFAQTTADRYRQAWDYGSILAFADIARNPAFLDYNAYALSDQARDRVRGFQEQVPAAEPLLAWISTPFHLDYARNRIIDAEPAGMTTPWAHVPPDVRYVLWQYRGVAVRPLELDEEAVNGTNPLEQRTAIRSYKFQLRLQELISAAQAGVQARVIAQDDEFVLLSVARFPD